ncbi:transposase [Streptomyces sp. NPDC086835]|uniref:transposase n=1 Tax=Streptomyces sp. NPDC086835 TaxID=3365761 RepID=UPI0037F4B93F
MSGRRTRATCPDEAWELIRPVITAWKARHPSVSGHTGQYEMREIVNAILYQARTGYQWRYLPHDLPPKSAVYYYFGKWRDDDTAETMHDLLRRQVRESRKRPRGPHRRRPGLPDRASFDERAEGHDRAGCGKEEPGPKKRHPHRRERVEEPAAGRRTWRAASGN